jgi:hypothetical protein
VWSGPQEINESARLVQSRGERSRVAASRAAREPEQSRAVARRETRSTLIPLRSPGPRHITHTMPEGPEIIANQHKIEGTVNAIEKKTGERPEGV